MGAKLSFKYDRDADILHIDKCSPYPDQESEELGTRSSRGSIRIRVRWRTLRCCFSRRGFCGASFSNCRFRQSYALLAASSKTPTD